MNKKKSILNFIITALLIAAFAVFTFIAMKVDVQDIGPQGSSVGLAAVNKKVAEAFGYNDVFYIITQCFGYVTVLIAASFAVLFFAQLIIKKGRGVDADLYLIMVFFLLIAGLYILFDRVALNYRPVLIKGELQPSYPSSHTLLAATVIPMAALQVKGRAKSRKTVVITCIAGALFAAATVVCRLISGVHWFTDIVGGILLGAALTMAYYSFTCLLKRRT